MLYRPFTVFGKNIKLSEAIVDDYEKIIDKKLTNKLAEKTVILACCESIIDKLTTEELQYVTERALRDAVYMPYISLYLYDNTKMITIDRQLVYLATNTIPFTAETSQLLRLIKVGACDCPVV